MHLDRPRSSEQEAQLALLPDNAEPTGDMSAQAGTAQAQQAYARQISQRLEKIAAMGYSPWQVFEDWLSLVEACLDALPDHLASALQVGRPAEDTPQTAALFEALRDRYQRHTGRCFQLFAESFAILLESSQRYLDVVGEVYQLFAGPNLSNAEFFTPWNVCLMMAQLVVGGDGEGEVHRRLKEAIGASPLAEAALLTSLLIEDPDEAFTWFVERILPAALPHYQPVSIYDPACGSGRMLLAAASLFPKWMVHLGLVRFAGMDINLTCVRMARINARLYGLNGVDPRYARAFDGLDAQSLDEDQGAARQAEPCIVSPDSRTGQAWLEQLSLFDVILEERDDPSSTP